MAKEVNILKGQARGDLALELIREEGFGLEAVQANVTDAAGEKHVPVIEVEGNKVTVTVGSVEHPMQDEHWIEFIYLETKKGGQLKYLNPGEKPQATFILEDDEAVAAYEYCNLHGLWKALV